jgi:hypothetical protein
MELLTALLCGGLLALGVWRLSAPAAGRPVLVGAALVGLSLTVAALAVAGLRASRPPVRDAFALERPSAGEREMADGTSGNGPAPASATEQVTIGAQGGPSDPGPQALLLALALPLAGAALLLARQVPRPARLAASGPPLPPAEATAPPPPVPLPEARGARRLVSRPMTPPRTVPRGPGSGSVR